MPKKRSKKIGTSKSKKGGSKTKGRQFYSEIGSKGGRVRAKKRTKKAAGRELLSELGKIGKIVKKAL